MNPSHWLARVLILGCLGGLALTACSGAASDTPTPTRTRTFTPAPTSTPRPMGGTQARSPAHAIEPKVERS